MPEEVDVRELIDRVVEGLEQLVRDLAELSREQVDAPDGATEADPPVHPHGIGVETVRPAPPLARPAAGSPRPGAARRDGQRTRRHRLRRGHDVTMAAWRDPPDGRGRLR